jgi:tricorn protease
VPTGLLGADWEAAGERYRIRRILRGQNWNPGLRAPLTEPGVDAREGDVLVSVDGRPVTTATNLHAAFQGTAGRTVEIALSAAADGSAARTSKVVPVDDESRLRRLDWVEERRRIVDRLSGGRLAYVYMPDTGDLGLAAFDRDFYSQVDRRGLVLDERYNGGGKVADHVVAVLSRKVWCWWRSREGWLGRTPWGTLQGPKVMVINESAGSGGDAMPWMFRKAGLGPLVGTRTWGGLVGISGYPPLMDGGSVTAASFGIVDTDGRWIVENEGVAPDHEVVEKPADALAGRDPQLEKAVAVALELMKGWKYDEPPAYRAPSPR